MDSIHCLFLFLKINRLDLMEIIFGKVLISQTVFDELMIDERFHLKTDQIKSEKFIAVKPVNNSESAIFSIEGTVGMIVSSIVASYIQENHFCVLAF